MNRKVTIALLLSVLLLLVLGAGCQKLKARDQLNKGVQAFKSAKYADAIENFKTAVDLDPNYPVARLYLAMAYMNQYIPGAESEENRAMAKAAEDHFLKVLEQEPNNTVALAYLASLHYNQAQGGDLEAKFKKFDEAKGWYQKLVTADPSNKEAFYSLGVISWNKAYPVRGAARVKLGMKPEDPGPIKDKKVREELVAKNMPLIEEGIKNLEKAIEIDKEYDDAMAYLNLLLRERADLAETPDGYKKDQEAADNWVSRALETKKIKATRPATQTGG